MRCEHHPGAPAIAKCGICEIPICGVCSNHTAKAILCDRCVNKVAMSDLFASRAAAASKVKTSGAPSGSGSPSAMSKLLEEGKSVNFDEPTAVRKRKSHSKIWDTIHVTGIFGCFIIIGFQLYTNYGAGAALTSSEIVAQERQRDQIESCVQIFWEIADVFNRGQVPADSLRCPDSAAPIIIARVDDNIIARHPRPEALGYSDIFISSNNPVPVLVQ